MTLLWHREIDLTVDKHQQKADSQRAAQYNESSGSGLLRASISIMLLVTNTHSSLNNHHNQNNTMLPYIFSKGTEIPFLSRQIFPLPLYWAVQIWFGSQEQSTAQRQVLSKFGLQEVGKKVPAQQYLGEEWLFCCPLSCCDSCMLVWVYLYAHNSLRYRKFNLLLLLMCSYGTFGGNSA